MDETVRMDPSPRDEPRVITLPPKERVNLALAVVAGALAVLVLFSAHDVLTRGAATATHVPAPSLATAAPTVAPTVQPAAPAQKPAKGKGHD